MRPRIRTVKPEALKHEGLWDLGEKTGLPIFQAFVGLWCLADREGRFEWRPRALKTDITPYWEGDFARVLDALSTRGFVVRYVSGGVEYGWIPSFKRHQAINNREEPSRLPEPPTNLEIPSHTEDFDACATRADACATREGLAQVERNGTEGNGRELFVAPPAPEPDPPKADPPRRPRPTPRWRRVPADWAPQDDHRALAGQLGVQFDSELAKFRDHEFRDPKTDADAAFRTWLRNAKGFGARFPAPGASVAAFDPFERARQLRAIENASTGHGGAS